MAAGNEDGAVEAVADLVHGTDDGTERVVELQLQQIGIGVAQVNTLDLGTVEAYALGNSPTRCRYHTHGWP